MPTPLRLPLILAIVGLSAAARQQTIEFYGASTVGFVEKASVAKQIQQTQKLPERVIQNQEWSAVKHFFRGTLGKAARGDLFEFRHLAVGQAAPEIEGKDLNGVAFHLSDYRGKVVMLDFWGQPAT